MQFHEGLIVLSNYQMRGSSGGPAVSATGRVVGVLSKGNTGAAYVVKINSIKPMLDRARASLAAHTQDYALDLNQSTQGAKQYREPSYS